MPGKSTHVQVATAGKDGSVFVLNVTWQTGMIYLGMYTCILNRHVVLRFFFVVYMVFRDCSIADFMPLPEQKACLMSVGVKYLP